MGEFSFLFKVSALLIVAMACIQLGENSAIQSAAPSPRIKYTAVVPNIQIVNDDVNELGEGPLFIKEENALYYIDATAGNFCRLDVTTRALKKVNVGGLVSMIVAYEGQPGTFLVSKRNQLLKLHFESGNTTLLATVAPENNGLERFNDAKVSPKGTLFIGTALETPQGGFIPNSGSLYRYDGGNNFTKFGTGYTVSNGMAWSNDKNHTKLFFNDSDGRKIYVFDYDIATDSLSNQRVLIDLDSAQGSQDFTTTEYPDGMVIDEFGYLWICMWNGGRIVKIDTDTGRVVDYVPLPDVAIPSSLARGVYQGRDGFFVTTASIGIAEANRKPGDGKIHHISFDGGNVYAFKP